MLDASRYERVVVDRYRYLGFHGCDAWCALETLFLEGGKSVVIATELADNPGTSITNVCEHLAYWVCVDFAIDPSQLVWIEYYGYPSPSNPKRLRTFDLVTFEILPPGHDAVFANPRWRPMRDADWQSLGLVPRRSAV
jgi:hypothetical protein